MEQRRKDARKEPIIIEIDMFRVDHEHGFSRVMLFQDDRSEKARKLDKAYDARN